jgi:hypothetical protein
VGSIRGSVGRGIVVRSMGIVDLVRLIVGWGVRGHLGFVLSCVRWEGEMKKGVCKDACFRVGKWRLSVDFGHA